MAPTERLPILLDCDPGHDVIPKDLDQEALLGPKVVVEEPPADARFARHMLEGGAGDAPLGDAVTHRVDDPLDLLAAQIALFAVESRLDGLRFHLHHLSP